MFKICCRCRKELPLTEFHKDKTYTKDGHKYTCKKCRKKEYTTPYARELCRLNVQKYRLKNREKIREYDKKYRQRPEIKERIKKYYMSPERKQHVKEYIQQPYVKKQRKKTTAIQRAKRRTTHGHIILMNNPFPKEIPVDYHHLKNELNNPNSKLTFMWAMPSKTHKYVNGQAKDNAHWYHNGEWIKKIYCIDINKFLKGEECNILYLKK